MGTASKYKAQHQTFSGAAQFIAASCITANVVIGNTTDETVLISETISADVFDNTITHFKVTIAGDISSDGTDDVAFQLRYGTTDILALTTVGLANEDDKQFRLEIYGRIHTTGATGKIVASGRLNMEQGTPLLVVNNTAVAGVTADLTVDGSINVTAQWDGAAATSTLTAIVGTIQFFNQ